MKVGKYHTCIECKWGRRLLTIRMQMHVDGQYKLMDRNTTQKCFFLSIYHPSYCLHGGCWPTLASIFASRSFGNSQTNLLIQWVGSFRLVPQMLKNATEEAKLYTSVGWLLLLGNNWPGRLLTPKEGPTVIKFIVRVIPLIISIYSIIFLVIIFYCA